MYNVIIKYYYCYCLKYYVLGFNCFLDKYFMIVIKVYLIVCEMEKFKVDVILELEMRDEYKL